LPWAATIVLVSAHVTQETAVTLTRLKEAGRRVCLICLADELPAQMADILTYHVPSTAPAFSNTNGRHAMTEAALRSIPAPADGAANGDVNNLSLEVW
jgi:hypothetical protein